MAKRNRVPKLNHALVLELKANYSSKIKYKKNEKKKRNNNRENKFKNFHVPYHAPNAKFIILIDRSN